MWIICILIFGEKPAQDVVIVIDISDVVAACMVKNYRKMEEKFRGNLITIRFNPKILPSDNKLVILKFNKASKV